MHKCIVVSTPGAKFSALALKEDFQSSLKKVAALGYDAVELAVRDPKLLALSELKELLDEYKLPVPAIGTGQAYGEEGLSFTAPQVEIREQAVQRIKEQMELAEELGGAQVIIGLIRGTLTPVQEKAQAEAYFLECMRECADYRPHITLTIEPLNRYETKLYNTIQATREFIDALGRPNIKMLIDTFHMNIEEADIVKSIIEAKNYLAHVHFADSNRHAPGCGHLDFPAVLKALTQIGYTGAISAEILPLPSPEESARLTIDYYRRLGL